MGNIMIGYGTRDGCTASVASRIATTLRTNAHHVEVVDLRDCESNATLCAEYDAIVVGGSLDDAAFQRDMHEWANQHCEVLGHRPSALFTVTSREPAETATARDAGFGGWSPTCVARCSKGLRSCEWYPVVDDFTQQLEHQLAALPSR
jgi:menaquinone-dependent protoporphyrinogen IX oxidase